MHLSLEQLRGFAEVARTGHFTQAAERLHVTQPSLSRQIAALEAGLGVDLFHRARGNIALTAAGERLLPFARRMLADAENAQAEMAELAGLTRGRVRLGTTPTLGTSIVTEVLAAYRDRYPGIDIDIVERGSRTLIADLVDGALDLALIVTTVSSGQARAVLVREPLLTERLVVVSAADRPDPCANGDALGAPDDAASGPDAASGSDARAESASAVMLAQLAAVPQIQFPQDYDLRAAMDAAFAREGLTPAVAVSGAEMDAALKFAERGIGVAVVPAMVAADRPSLRARRLADPALTRTVSIARRSDMTPTHSAAAMQALIEEVAAALTAPGSPLADLIARA